MSFVGRVGRIVLVLVAALALPATVAVVDTRAAFAGSYTAPPPAPSPLPAPPAHDPTRRTAVVVASTQGAAVSDALGAYEALAATGAFNVYLAAPDRHPLPLTGGLDVLPDLSFADVDQRLGGAAPDLVVVPAVPDAATPTSRPVEEWVARQWGRSLVVSICNGAGVLASAGLLDGHRATAHWTRIDSWQQAFPAVDWQRGQRWIDDGALISTAGVLSGIDGTLHAIDRLLGPAAAARAAVALHWTPRPVVQEQHTWSPADAIVALNAGFRWDPPRIGVLLTDGVSESALAAVFDTYGAQVLATRTVALGAEVAQVVRSRHGLVLLTRGTVADTAVDRLLVPGGVVPRINGGPAPELVPARGTDPFDAVLHDVAAHVDVPTARWVARAMEYPDADLEFTGPGWPVGLVARPFLLAAVGVGLVAAVGGLRRARAKVSA
ncbi:DJ-1/PfpI family protein [Pseudonocardia sp. CA-107938]|uniref:DJ-1/PfpI family protein n=1 Tax=Pseudonocardia sp. CA-107938 TaxID=3240021 RepID=UPI003D8A5BDB